MDGRFVDPELADRSTDLLFTADSHMTAASATQASTRQPVTAARLLHVGQEGRREA